MFPPLAALLLACVCGRLDALPPADVRAPRAPGLVWYTSLPRTIAWQMKAEFVRRNPGLEVAIENPARLYEPTERSRAHRRRADVVTDIALDARPGFPRAGAFARLELPAADAAALCPGVRSPDGSIALTHAAPVPLQFQNEVVADRDAPGSLSELASPRWKGKTALLAPSAAPESDCLYRFVASHPDLGFPWLEKMRDSDVLLLDAAEAVRAAVVTGVRPVAWGVPGLTADDDRARTAVGARAAREGSVLMAYGTAISARAPHPAAARRFVSWLLDAATRKEMAANGWSLPLLRGSCEQLERGPVCGRGPAASPSEAEAFRRRVWKSLLGGGHIAR